MCASCMFARANAARWRHERERGDAGGHNNPTRGNGIDDPGPSVRPGDLDALQILARFGLAGLSSLSTWLPPAREGWCRTWDPSHVWHVTLQAASGPKRKQCSRCIPPYNQCRPLLRDSLPTPTPHVGVGTHPFPWLASSLHLGNGQGSRRPREDDECRILTGRGMPIPFPRASGVRVP